MMTPQEENKTVTLYAIVEDTKETVKKIEKSAFKILNNRPVNDPVVRSLPLFPSFRGSLIDAAEKVTYEQRKWLRLVLKTKINAVSYPDYQFEKTSDVPFYLLDAYEEAFEAFALKETNNPPKYIENGKELGSIFKINYIDGEDKRFSFYYKDKESGRTSLSPVFSLKTNPELFNALVHWFLNRDDSFKAHYNKLMKRALLRQPSEIIDSTNPNVVTVVNPASVSVVCTNSSVWPTLTHVTRINNKMLPVRSEYKYFLKQDVTNPRAFNLLETPQARYQIGWKYAIQGGTVKVPELKKGKEKVKVNVNKSKTSLWRWVFSVSKKAHQK